ncbi:putative metallopeptidase domain containing protein [Alkalidesulfovibrio alkalitolerans DSM 16529]|uniref:Putative metallopeptidase domain containing protein n=1 Tax=Alkalidesulfovibrio alkalitolerans DSM 16529 TaxID=1121439 RepID=S7TEP8_9BACT|nr:VWA-like domain-containing protein [Alkalidesulfovibrio alkalitolerans]EPR35662.1 putative metallopeptidase domain containing protein [Alkalidesulfovibrio alkalitolerans DSM 16529]
MNREPGSAVERLARARVELLMRAPFFGVLALRLRLAEDSACAGLWTDGKTLAVNPDRLNRLSDDELVGAVAHEVLHLALAHHLRRGGREASRWNAATDYAVNPLVQEAGFRLPTGRLFNASYARMAAEDIYESLPGAEPEQSRQGRGKRPDEPGDDVPKDTAHDQAAVLADQEADPGGVGEVRDFPDRDEAAREAEQRLWGLALREAMHAAGGLARMPERLARVIAARLPGGGRIDWRQELARFLEESARTDYLWTMPNRRYLPSGVVLPGLSGRRMGRLTAMVDTSGSVDRQALSALVAECLELLGEAGQEHGLRVLYVDAAVAGSEVLFPGDVPHPTGGGGTSYRPGFEWLRERGEEDGAVVYFTDGECADFPPPPPSPVLWVLAGDNPRFAHSLPFGRAVALGEDVIG